MNLVLVAVRAPRPTHRKTRASRAQFAADITRPTSGCATDSCWSASAGDAVVTTAHSESMDARTSSLATARTAGVAFAFTEREMRPHEVRCLRCGQRTAAAGSVSADEDTR